MQTLAVNLSPVSSHTLKTHTLPYGLSCANSASFFFPPSSHWSGCARLLQTPRLPLWSINPPSRGYPRGSCGSFFLFFSFFLEIGQNRTPQLHAENYFATLCRENLRVSVIFSHRSRPFLPSKPQESQECQQRPRKHTANPDVIVAATHFSPIDLVFLRLALSM